MAVHFDKLDKATRDEMCCTYAALILYDEGLEISSEKINKVITASGNKVDAYWPGLFSRALQGKNVGDILLGASGSGSASAGATGGAAGKADAGKKDEKKEDKKEPAKKETKKVEEKPADDDVDMGGGLGLFDEF